MLYDFEQPLPADRPPMVWMVNSTRDGGGVAEMLPNIQRALRMKGFMTSWPVLQTTRKDFFKITKALHNMLHDNGTVMGFTDEQKGTFEEVSREAAEHF